MKIYTKTGDKGETSLFDGTRVKKSNKRIESYGSVDEINSQIGVLCSHLSLLPECKDISMLLSDIQRQLFVLGSDLANPKLDLTTYPRITDSDVKFLEDSIDRYEQSLDPLQSFIIPGGNIQSSQCHVIRTVIRRAEISISDLFLADEINPLCLIFINRLSDFFFVLARVCNKRQKIPDILWKKNDII